MTRDYDPGGRSRGRITAAAASAFSPGSIPPAGSVVSYRSGELAQKERRKSVARLGGHVTVAVTTQSCCNIHHALDTRDAIVFLFWKYYEMYSARCHGPADAAFRVPDGGTNERAEKCWEREISRDNSQRNLGNRNPDRDKAQTRWILSPMQSLLPCMELWHTHCSMTGNWLKTSC